MKILFLLLISVFSLFADTDLQSLFEQLQQTPPSQKYKIINKIKLHITQLNAEQRLKAIENLKRKQNIHVDKKHINEQIINHDMIMNNQESMHEKMHNLPNQKIEQRPEHNINQNNIIPKEKF